MPSVPDRSLFRWLVASCVAVLLALVIGGITRLTESGLSITEWKPVSGVLPPMTASHWDAAFQSYLQIPEAQTVHQGITLQEFKALYWWEFIHRILARLVGLVIALPYFVLLARHALNRRQQWWLGSLPILVGMQGVLGWYMVKSGLSGRTDVSQYRLVAHLGLALIIYVIAAWHALGIRQPERTGAPHDQRALWLSVLVFVTILSGGFVAGLDAGHIYNTFPLMDGGVVPRGYGQLVPSWLNLFENPAAVQFNHRLLATTTLVAATWLGMRQARDPRWRLVLIAVAVQYVLGITTLLTGVSIPIAALHQLGAVALLTAAMAAIRTPQERSASFTTRETTSALNPRRASQA